MQLKIKNKHLFFALDSIWQNVDYKFKYAVHLAVEADSDNETYQTLEVTAEMLRVFISNLNLQPQGIAREINPEMFMEILPQVQAEAMQGNAEAIEMLTDMQSATAANDAAKLAKIENGKTKILS